MHAPDGIRMYLNGRPAATLEPPGPIGDRHPEEDELRIGGRQRESAVGFRGLIDDVRIWSVARDGEAIRTDMRRALRGDEPGLVGSWRFDEGSGETARDQTGRYHATLCGATWRATRSERPLTMSRRCSHPRQQSRVVF